MDCSHGVLYAGTGCHHPQHRPSRYCAKPQPFPAGDAVRHHQLHPDGRHADPGQRLAGRPLRHPQSFHAGRHALYARFAGLCALLVLNGAGHLPRITGYWRRDDDAGGAPCPTASLPSKRTASRAQLRHHAGAGWPDTWPGTRRRVCHLGKLALDLPD